MKAVADTIGVARSNLVDHLRRPERPPRGALRQDALLDKPPQRDGKLSGQRHDAYLARAAALGAEGAPVPLGQAAGRLVAEPGPSQLDE